MAHHNQLGLSEPLKLVLGVTDRAGITGLVTIRHNPGKVYFTLAEWRIFYVSTLENILRFLSGEYSTYPRSRIFYVSRVENILRILGRVYSTVVRWRIKYGAQVGNILRILGREYSTVGR